MNQDLEHLKILSILFYVKAGLTALTALFFGIYIVFGAMFMSMDIPHKAGEPNPAMLGGFFIIFGLVFIVLFGALAALAFWTGRNLAKRNNYTFCMVVACLVCLSIPLGTILGVFTIIVLLREPVKAAFNGQNYSPNNTPPNWQ